MTQSSTNTITTTRRRITATPPPAPAAIGNMEDAAVDSGPLVVWPADVVLEVVLVVVSTPPEETR